MKQYLDLIKDILENGEDQIDRTGVGTRSVFGRQLRYNLQDGFPLVTSKFTSFKTIFKELVWYLRGEGNTKFLKENGVTIWDEWADENGDLGRVYGTQYRHWLKYDIIHYEELLNHPEGNTTTYYGAKVRVSEVDQIKNLIDGLKNNPYSRRHIVTAWNVAELDQMALPPCHMTYQFNVTPSGKLNCMLLQRSVDTCLGAPYNIACYSILTHILAKLCGYEAGEFIHTMGDAHIYHNHIEGAKEMLNREPYSLPKLIVPDNLSDINQIVNGEITWDDFKLEGYQYHPKINFDVAV